VLSPWRPADLVLSVGPTLRNRRSLEGQLAPSDHDHGGRAKNEGLVLKLVPDDVMRGLEFRKGSIDLVVKDLAPDIVYHLAQEPALRVVESPGIGDRHIGLNRRDSRLKDRGVRQAIGDASDRQAVVSCVRRGPAVPPTGILPPASWALTPNLLVFCSERAKASALLDDAGCTNPDGDAHAIIADEASYVRSWYKTAVAVALRSLVGIQFLPPADFAFPKDVSRTAPGRHATN
jgi:ABC-type transport system substrate-binding protein